MDLTPPPLPTLADQPEFAVGGIRTMPLTMTCRVCGASRPLWLDLAEGFARGHEACARRVVHVTVPVPAGTSSDDAVRRWTAVVEEQGWTPLGGASFHNPDLHQMMGLDFLNVSGDALTPDFHTARSHDLMED